MDWFAAPGYDLARLVVQRGVALVYVLAFVNVLVEWRPLLGDRGLLPATAVTRRRGFRQVPSVFHLRHDDRAVAVVAWTGLVLAVAGLGGLLAALPTVASVVAWLTLWALYLSFVNVGRVFYGFGWESILLEAGFLAAFLGADDVAPPLLTLWLVRWLVFRIEFGAGLIKLRGDPCWRDLTCLEYHHETQPLPGPLSRRFHLLPRWMHRAETAANHVVQLVVPFGLFLPQPIAGAAAVAIVATQSWLLLSGNFAWLNLVTIVLACAAIPDGWFEELLPGLVAGPSGTGGIAFVGLVVAVTAGTVVLSWWPVRNMASRRQQMNASFNPFHLVGTYGAFGSVTRVRHEIVVEGTRADDADDPETVWEAYGFLAKPGDPARRPPQVAPFHRRLDWLLWFAAMSPTPDRHPWFLRLLRRLAEADPDTRRLLRNDPFGDDPPTWLRARRERYRFTTGEERRATGDWWHVEPAGDYVRAVRCAQLRSGPDAHRPARRPGGRGTGRRPRGAG